MNKKQIASDVIEVFIWVALFACVLVGGYLIWHHGWRK